MGLLVLPVSSACAAKSQRELPGTGCSGNPA